MKEINDATVNFFAGLHGCVLADCVNARRAGVRGGRVAGLFGSGSYQVTKAASGVSQPYVAGKALEVAGWARTPKLAKLVG